MLLLVFYLGKLWDIENGIIVNYLFVMLSWKLVSIFQLMHFANIFTMARVKNCLSLKCILPNSSGKESFYPLGWNWGNRAPVIFGLLTHFSLSAVTNGHKHFYNSKRNGQIFISLNHLSRVEGIKKVRLNLRKGHADNGWFWDKNKSSFELQSSLLCNFPC